jgi:hypothetical protein
MRRERHKVAMRKGFIEQGCSFTLVCWVGAILLSLGSVMGDCIGEPGRDCPTDHQRDMGVLKVVLGAAALNIGALLLLGYRHTSSHKD